MEPKKIVRPAGAPPPVGPYSHAVRIGDLLFCSGQIPLDPESGDLVCDEIRTQTEQVLENVKRILEHEDLTFAHVVKTTVYLANMTDFAAMNDVYARYFTGACPARSTVQVAGLPKGARVEIEVIAHY